MGGTIKLWKFWFSRLPSCGQNIWRWSRCGNREPPERSSCREKRTLSDKHFYVWQKSSSANIFTLCYLSENISIIVFWKQRPSAKNTEIPFMSASVYGGTKTHFSFHQTLHSVPSCLNPIYQQGKNQSSSEDEIDGGEGDEDKIWWIFQLKSCSVRLVSSSFWGLLNIKDENFNLTSFILCRGWWWGEIMSHCWPIRNLIGFASVFVFSDWISVTSAKPRALSVFNINIGCLHKNLPPLLQFKLLLK